MNSTPSQGDLILTSDGRNVWLNVVEAVETVTLSNGKAIDRRTTKTIGWSDVMLRKRCFRYDSPALYGGRVRYKESKDFTPGKVGNGWGPWLLAKYCPDLKGRRVFRFGSTWDAPQFEGVVGETQRPASTHGGKVEVVAREAMEYVPGAILYSSWGYEQTNIDYFEIVKRKGCWVWVESIGSAAADNGNEPWMTGKSLPNPEARGGDVMKRRVRVYNGKEHSIRIDDVRDAWLWDGKRKSWSSYH